MKRPVRSVHLLSMYELDLSIVLVVISFSSFLAPLSERT